MSLYVFPSHVLGQASVGKVLFSNLQNLCFWENWSSTFKKILDAYVTWNQYSILEQTL